MAVDRAWHSGAEVGNTDEVDSIIGSNFTVQSALPYTGTYSFRVTSGGGLNYGIINLTATRQVRGGFRAYNLNTTTVNEERGWLAFRNIGGTHLARFKTLGAAYGNLQYIDIASSNVDSAAYNQADWAHYGFDLYIHSSSGWFYLYKDGSLIMEFDGNTGNSDIYSMVFGYVYDPAGGAADMTGGPVYIDDVYIDDTTGEGSPTAPQIKSFYYIGPNGDGNYSQWTPIPTGSHYQNVDERPPNDDTDYLEAVTGSLLDSFTMTTFTLDTNENIIAMIPFAIAKRGSSTEQLSLGTRSSGTDLIGSAQDLSTSYDYYWERQVTGSLGFDWDQSYLDSVEVIINSTGTY